MSPQKSRVKNPDIIISNSEDINSVSIDTFSDSDTETDVVYPLEAKSSKFEKSKFRKMRTIKLKDFANIKNNIQKQTKNINSPFQVKKPDNK